MNSPKIDIRAAMALANQLGYQPAVAVPDAASAIRPGQIYALANDDSRFAETFFSEPLTTFAVGYKDPNDIEGALEFFSPKVIVPGRLFEWKKWSNAEEFYQETDDVRAIGADFKRVEYTGIDQTGKTLNKGLMMIIDLDQVPLQMPGWEQRFVAKLIRRLLRNDLYRSIAILAAAAANTAKNWNSSADPDSDVVQQGVVSADAQGFQFNRVGYGHTAWAQRFLSLRANNNAAKFATAGMTVAELAPILGVDQVYVSRERYQSTKAAKSQVVGNLVLMFTAMAGQDIEDPSNIKRFVSPPPNVMTNTGGADVQRPTGALDINVYMRQISAKKVELTVEHYSNIILTSSLGIEKFTTTSTS
jgi:hypothetical protein